MSLDVNEMEAIRKIIGDEIEELEKQLEKSMDSRFKQLEGKIESSQIHTEDMIKSRVSDNTCASHRQNQIDKISEQDVRIATMEATQKTTNRIVTFILGMIVPLTIIGVVYGIMLYQQVQVLTP